MRRIAKLLLIASVALALLPLQWLAVRFDLPSRRRLPIRFHRAVLRIMGVHVHVVGAASAERPLLFVSNHVSWLDISVLGSLLPLCFIAKQEVATWPVFGLFAKLQRSIFVDRSRRQKTGEVNEEIAARLKGGDPVVLFGEGTSSDGNRVLPFRSALIGAAHDVLEHDGGTRVLLQPVSIAYTRVDGLPMGRTGRPHIAWYGDIEMIPHLLSVLKRSAIDVVVTFGTPLTFDEASQRKALTRDIEQTVREMTAKQLSGRAETAPVPFSPENG